MKNELNINNVVYIINQQTPFQNLLPNGSNLQQYRIYLDNLLNYFYEEITIEKFKEVNMGIGSFCKFDDYYREKELYDINKIEFNSFYPNIILKLFENNKIKFSSPEFAQFYQFIVTNKNNIYNHPDTDINTKSILRFIINYLFGASTSTFNRKFIIDNPQMIVDYGRDINTKIYYDYNPIYIDTDTIYINEINDDFIQFLDSCELPYTISYKINALFFRIKKFITEDNGEIKIRGLQQSNRSIKNNRPIQYKKEMNDFKNNIKIRNRNLKIRKILSRGKVQ